jgi:hypothetical protein
MVNKEQENKKILKGEEQGDIESPPDPKTVSNATRVDEWVDVNGVRHTAADRDSKKNAANNQKGSNIDEDVDELPPSSDQPEEIARKAREELQHEEKGRKKEVVEGGDKDVSHATIGKDEEKEAREEKKAADKKSDNKKSSK